MFPEDIMLYLFVFLTVSPPGLALSCFSRTSSCLKQSLLFSLNPSRPLVNPSNALEIGYEELSVSLLFGALCPFSKLLTHLSPDLVKFFKEQ